MKKSAWIYPKAAHARKEYTDGRIIDTLKPEYATVTSDGTVRVLTVEKDGQLGLSEANAQSVKDHCKNPVFTVSCKGVEAMEALCSSPTRRASAVADIVGLAQHIGFNGVEENFEPAGDWTGKDYADFQQFTEELRKALNDRGMTLSVCVPPITALNDPANGQQLYRLKYEEISNICDFVVIMAYDKQYDHGNGTPVAPLGFLKEVCSWALQHIPKEKIIIGLPLYGYHGRIGQTKLSLMNYYQATKKRGFEMAERNQDGEMYWQIGRQYFCFQDIESINIKTRVIADAGLDHVCFWVMGNNLWPNI